TIWSRRASKRSLCPLSRRSLGRIESPSAKPTERQNHDQTPRSICNKSSRQPLLSCKRNALPIPGNASKIRQVRILHGRQPSPDWALSADQTLISHTSCRSTQTEGVGATSTIDGGVAKDRPTTRMR